MSKKDCKLHIIDLTKKLGRLEINHFELVSVLKHYESPNKKIHDLVKSGELIRIQRGLYSFSSQYSSLMPSKEVLAQMLHGPSYLSLEWALAYYNLIPEQVHTVTSITTKRKRRVQTQFGLFDYQHLSLKRYSIGYKSESFGRNSFLIATPLKSIVDTVYFRIDKTTEFDDSGIEELLEDDFRIDLDDLLSKITQKEILELKKVYQRIATVKKTLDWLYRRTT